MKILLLLLIPSFVFASALTKEDMNKIMLENKVYEQQRSWKINPNKVIIIQRKYTTIKRTKK